MDYFRPLNHLILIFSGTSNRFLLLFRCSVVLLYMLHFINVLCILYKQANHALPKFFERCIIVSSFRYSIGNVKTKIIIEVYGCNVVKNIDLNEV